MAVGDQGRIALRSAERAGLGIVMTRTRNVG